MTCTHKHVLAFMPYVACVYMPSVKQESSSFATSNFPLWLLCPAFASVLVSTSSTIYPIMLSSLFSLSLCSSLPLALLLIDLLPKGLCYHSAQSYMALHTHKLHTTHGHVHTAVPRHTYLLLYCSTDISILMIWPWKLHAVLQWLNRSFALIAVIRLMRKWFQINSWLIICVYLSTH